MSLATEIISKIRKVVENPTASIKISALNNMVHTRIFTQLLDVDERRLDNIDETPLFESGETIRTTQVRDDGMWVVEYYSNIEKAYGTTIFDLTERELDEIGKLIADEIDRL